MNLNPTGNQAAPAQEQIVPSSGPRVMERNKVN